tara:strand:- start:296 stop:850 length:555 start_codon:yes stop_codon:yes gene_type:complete
MELVIIRQEDMVEGNTYYVGQGTRPFIFIGFTGRGECAAQYPESTRDLRVRPYFYEQANQTKENTMTKLYEINTNGVSTYGAKLAVNSSGDWVMELKGTGAVVSVPKENVKEVLPYSVEVEFTQGKAGLYSYLARKEDWVAGDLVIIPNTSGVARVIKVNSASRSASRWITGVKLQGSFITAGE